MEIPVDFFDTSSKTSEYQNLYLEMMTITNKSLRQFIKFSLVGLLNTTIHYGTFYVLFKFMGVYHLLASAIGFCIAVANSYVINKRWTFKSSNTDVRGEFSKFLIVNLVSLAINLTGMAILVERFSIYPTIAQLFTIGFTVIVNFTGNKLWTFRVKPEDIAVYSS